jgi:hypothetical protein
MLMRCTARGKITVDEDKGRRMCKLLEEIKLNFGCGHNNAEKRYARFPFADFGNQRPIYTPLKF